MIREILRTILARSPAYARRLGLVHEHAAIAARHRRMRHDWTPHLEASRAIILEAAVKSRGRGRVLVIGAGDCLDVPVAELATQFTSVVLADIVVSPVARRIARGLRGFVSCVNWDATGALARLAAVRAGVRGTEARRIFEKADPGPPPGGEPDLVISANCLSQLGLVPGHALAAASCDTSLPDRCATAAAKVHLSWLERRMGAVRVLLADVARIDLASDGRELKHENLLTRLPLRPPDRRWSWYLARIPEHSTDFHRVHEVGAWIDLPPQVH